MGRRGKEGMDELLRYDCQEYVWRCHSGNDAGQCGGCHGVKGIHVCSERMYLEVLHIGGWLSAVRVSAEHITDPSESSPHLMLHPSIVVMCHFNIN